MAGGITGTAGAPNPIASSHLHPIDSPCSSSPQKLEVGVVRAAPSGSSPMLARSRCSPSARASKRGMGIAHGGGSEGAVVVSKSQDHNEVYASLGRTLIYRGFIVACSTM